VINWACQLEWTADSVNDKAEFVHQSLESWVPHYLWKDVNPALASLAQIMSIQKNHSKLVEVLSRPQYIYIQEKLLKMVTFYQCKKDNTKAIAEED